MSCTFLTGYRVAVTITNSVKIVVWTDENGWKHRSLLRDDDPEYLAPAGIPRDPPDIQRLDWEEIKRLIHNELIERELETWKDVEASQNGLTSSILAVLKRQLVGLYRAAPPTD